MTVLITLLVIWPIFSIIALQHNPTIMAVPICTINTQHMLHQLGRQGKELIQLASANKNGKPVCVPPLLNEPVSKLNEAMQDYLQLLVGQSEISFFMEHTITSFLMTLS